MDDKRLIMLWTTVAGLAVMLCVPAAQAQVASLTGEVVWSEDFEAGWGDWYTDLGVWEIGEPNSGPSEAHGGQGIGGTNLSGNYPRSTDSRLISPFVVLPEMAGEERLVLKFWEWYSYSDADAGYVQISVWTDADDWGAWSSLATGARENTSSGWSLVAIDLTPYADKIIRLAFLHMANDSSTTSLGWSIDDVCIWKGRPNYVNPEGFEFGWDDWYTDFGVWEVGKPTVGPDWVPEGRAVAGTNLSGNYPRNTDSRLISPVLDLPDVVEDEQIELRFWQWYSYSDGDAAHVEISVWTELGWGPWNRLITAAWENTSSSWTPLSIELTAYAGQTIRLGFYHVANNSSTVSSGWCIDDVRIWKGRPTFVNPETFEFGWGDWYADAGIWEIGQSTFGPGQARDGQGVAATSLSGNYRRGTDSRLISPPLTLPFAAGPQGLTLRFWQAYSYSHGDSAYVLISVWTDAEGWGDWERLFTAALPNTSSDWAPVSINLGGYAGETVRLGFHHTANDSSTVSSGWYIDDVEISPWPEAWMVSEDTGISRTDRLTNDTTPQLTFVFPHDVYGHDSDIVIRDPEGSTLVPDSISGWGTDTIVVDIATPLTVNGPYVIVLMTTITDAQGHPINNGTMKIMHFTLDTMAPFLTCNTVVTPEGVAVLTGEIDDPDATIEVVFEDATFRARNNGDGTWVLPIEMIDSTGSIYDMDVIATDRAGNVGNCGDCELLLSATEGGSITEPGEGTFGRCDETIQVEAVADEGYRFVRWEGTAWDAGKVTDIDTNDSGSVVEVLVDGIHTLKAVFTPLCSLTLEATGQGSVDASVGDEYLACGTTVQVAAKAEVGHRFVRWEGTASDADKVTVLDANDSGSTADVLVDGAYTLKAVFEPLCCLTLGVVGQGSIDLGVGDRYYACGTTVDVCATANEGYKFVRWEGTAVPEGAATEPCISVELDGGDGCETLTAVFETVIYDEPLDSDPGWVLEGQWEFGVPTGQRCSGWGNVDPTSGHTGQNVIGVNLQGCYDLEIGGPYSAIAGPFDLSSYSDISLRFRRWLNCDIPEYVRSTIEVSTDGQTWSVVWQQGEREEITDTEWILCEYPIPQADLESTVYVRWTYEVVQERAYAYTGWNLDDIQVIGAPQ